MYRRPFFLKHTHEFWRTHEKRPSATMFGPVSAVLSDGVPLDGGLLDGKPLDGEPLDGVPLDGELLDGAHKYRFAGSPVLPLGQHAVNDPYRRGFDARV